MTTISDIQHAIRALSKRDFETFASWFEQFEEERWDRQIERDQKTAPLRDLVEKARSDFAAGKCKRL
ncbi:MAG: hypothetical protein ACLQVA_15560 [Candidatus Brocadiia bacterium]